MGTLASGATPGTWAPYTGLAYLWAPAGLVDGGGCPHRASIPGGACVYDGDLVLRSVLGPQLAIASPLV